MSAGSPATHAVASQTSIAARGRAAEWQEQIKKDRENLQGALGKDPEKGFLNLDKQLVMALVKAGLSWGGTLDNQKDIHHFDFRGGTIKRNAASSTAK